MDADSHPGPDAGSARLLLALRHALADPLSTAALKLDLVERRLTSPAGADPSWILERVRAAQAEVTSANLLLELLRRLAEIAEEMPERTSLSDVCGAAGLQIEAAPAPAIVVRRTAAADAVRGVVSYLAPGGASSAAHARDAGDAVSLELRGERAVAPGDLARLLDLPHADRDAEALYLARAAVQADGGRLELFDRAGSLAVLFTWPAAPREAGA